MPHSLTLIHVSSFCWACMYIKPVSHFMLYFERLSFWFWNFEWIIFNAFSRYFDQRFCSQLLSIPLFSLTGKCPTHLPPSKQPPGISSWWKTKHWSIQTHFSPSYEQLEGSSPFWDHRDSFQESWHWLLSSQCGWWNHYDATQSSNHQQFLVSK